MYSIIGLLFCWNCSTIHIVLSVRGMLGVMMFKQTPTPFDVPGPGVEGGGWLSQLASYVGATVHSPPEKCKFLGPLGPQMSQNSGFRILFFSCDQAAIWLVQSVRPSVCPSVRPSVTPFSPCSHHRIIMKFSGVITNDKSDVHAKGQGQRSKVKVTEVTTQLNRFRTVTPVWIHIWWWNDAYSLMMLRRGALLFLKVIRQISRSHGSKKRRIWPRLCVSGL